MTINSVNHFEKGRWKRLNALRRNAMKRTLICVMVTPNTPYRIDFSDCTIDADEQGKWRRYSSTDLLGLSAGM